MRPSGKALLCLVVRADIAQARRQARIDAARPEDETLRRARFGRAKRQLKLLAQQGWKKLRRQGAICAAKCRRARGDGSPSRARRE